MAGVPGGWIFASVEWKVTMTGVKVVAVLDARAGRADELMILLMGMVAPSRAEPGNMRWDVWQDQAKPDRFVLDELYTDAAAVALHRETPHFKNYVAKISDLAERTPFALNPIEVARHTREVSPVLPEQTEWC